MLPYSPLRLPKGLFLNNAFVPSTSPSKLSVFNPKDESLVADDIDNAREDDVDAAVQFAEAAFPSWRRESAENRRKILSKFADLIEQHGPALAELSRITMGAPYGAFGKFEISTAVENFRYYAGFVDKFPGESQPQEDGFLKIVRNEPLGVCAGIAPWNGPTGNFSLKAAPALAAGNCFIMKPSEKSPFSALALGALAVEAGFPPGVLQVLTGDGVTGALLAAHMRIRKISFTGSVATGKKVAELAAKSNLKRVTLELGGKSPLVVFEDADVDEAVKWSSNMITANTGQLCIAPSRVYIHERLYVNFKEKFRLAMEARAATMGDPEDDSTGMGPLADSTQFDRVTGFIERAKKSGAGQLLTGGERVGAKGYFIPPTAFADIDTHSEIHTDEVFGPVAVLKSFRTEEEVLALANDSEFGLMAGIFTQDIDRALRIASDVDSGMVGINCVSMLFSSAPFGGSKQSGWGREGGIHAMRAYTEPKTIFINMTRR